VRFLARTSSRLRGRVGLPHPRPASAQAEAESEVASPESDADEETGDDAEDADDAEETGATETETEIVAVDPAAVTLAVAGRLAALDRTEMVSSGRDLATLSARALHAAVRDACAGLWVAGSPAQPLGWAMLTDHEGYGAVLHGDVAHHRRHQGIGGLLLAQALDQARLDGRDEVLATTWEGSDSERFLRRHGFVDTDRPARAVRRLELVASAERRRRIIEDVTSHAADYQVVRAAEELTEGGTVYRVFAHHQAGVEAGRASLSVADGAPEYAVHGDLTVEPGHRGHRLGLLMATELLRWIEAERPAVRVAQSQHPLDASYTIAIMDRLGSRIAGVRVPLRHPLG
jgi:GNAT superfamily N-acetyltransferase